MVLTEKVDSLKAKYQLPLRDLEREKLMFKERKELGLKLGLKPNLVTKLFKLILSFVIKRHKELRTKTKKQKT